MRRRIAAGLVSLALCLLAHPRRVRADGVSPSVVSLPSGPGSIEGLGSNFEASPASGGATYSVPFRMPPAVGGLGPGLAIAYANGGGVTEVGLGWRFDTPAIRRRTDDGLPRYDATDTFALSGLGADGDLVPLGDDAFRLRFEGAFVRVQRRGDVWEVRERSGMAHYFGEQPAARDGADSQASRWHLTRTVDLHGHEVRYGYVRDGGHSYLSEVRYGGTGAAEVVVTCAYEGRPDVLTSYQSGQPITLARRLASVTIARGGQVVATYTLRYDPGPGLSRLREVGMTGADGVTSLPAVRFEYGQPDFTAAHVATLTAPPGHGLQDPNNDLLDVDGDGVADLLVTAPGRYSVYRNDGGAGFDAPYEMAQAPSLALSQAGVQLADMDGDAVVDLVAKVGIARDGFRFYPGGDRRAFGDARPFAQNPAFTFEDADVRLVDLDFDRRTDVLITTASGPYVAFNTGGDFTTPAAVGAIDATQALRLSDPNVRLADLNGDRLQDVAYLRSGALVYWPARGRGGFDAPITLRDVPTVPDARELQLIDLTGDGLPDLVRVGVTVVELWPNLANGAFAAQPVTMTGTPERRTTTAVRFADMNGNGTTDVLWVDVAGTAATAWRYLDVVGDAGPGLLTRVENGLGDTTTITYRASGAYAADDARTGQPWSTRLPHGQPVVAEIAHDDGLGAIERTRFAYHEGLYDGPTREFRGFGRATRTDVGDAAQPTLVTAMVFDLGQANEALKGRLRATTRADDQGGVFDRAETRWEVVTVATGRDGRAVQWARSRRSEHTLTERTATPRVTRTELDYDGDGNVTTERAWGLVDGDNGLVGGDERFTRRTYARNAEAWILDRLATEEVTDAAGRRVAAHRVHYDGAPFVGLPVGDVTRGDVTRTEGWRGPRDDDWIDQATQAFDTDGNVVEHRDGDGRRRVLEWDPATRAFPVRETIPFADGRVLSWRLEYDARWGVATAVTAPDGTRTTVVYDTLGRRTAVVEPGDSLAQPTVRYGYVFGAPLSRVEVAERETSGTEDVLVHVTLLDGRHRERARLVEHEDGGWVVERFSRYGARGLDTVQARPFAAPQADASVLAQAVVGTHLHYDPLGRVVATELPDGTRTRVDREPLRERAFDANDLDPGSRQFDTPDVRVYDGLGRLVERRDASREGDAVWQYGYDPAGRLRRRVDPLGAVASYDYDGLGRRTLTDDPDGGHRASEYDRAGNLIAATNARGQRLTWGYDAAGRPLAHDRDGDGRDDTFWRYDVGCDFGPGHLCQLEEPRLVTAFAYDARGRTTRTRWTVDGQTWGAENVYDALGRVTRHVYPDGSAVDYRFNARGLVSSIGDLVRSTEYGLDGQPRTRVFANGVREARRQDARGRLEAIGYVGPASQVYEDLSREYDAVGNIEVLHDHRPDRTPTDDRSETYGYDGWERLTDAHGSYGSIRWRYDAAARLLERTSDVAALQLGALTYPTSMADPQPHGPRTAGSHALTYDADGNVATLDGRTLRWDARNYATEVPTEDGRVVESWYDALGARRIERVHGGNGADETTVLLSPLEELRNGQLVRYVRAGDETLFIAEAQPPPTTAAMGSATARGPPAGHAAWLASLAVLALLLSVSRRPRRWRWALVLVPWALACEAAPPGRAIRPDEGLVVLRDFTGSTLALVGPDGALRERDVRYPGGMLRRGDGTPRYRRYGNSQRQATPGLAYVGPRVLLPTLGLWLSPAAGTLEGGEESPYTYCDGNAVSRVDADGRDWLAEVLYHASNLAEGSARGLERITQAAEAVTAAGVPAVSQVTGAWVYGVRGTQAATGEGFSGQRLSTEQRVRHAVSAVAGAATAAGQRQVAQAANGVAVILDARAAVRGGGAGAGQAVLSAAVSTANMARPSDGAGGGGGGGAQVPRGGTYVLRDPATGRIMRSGRTNDLARRREEHGRDPALRDLRFEPVHRTDVYAEQRGLEQMLHETHQPPLNRVGGIDPRNPRLPGYREAAREYLGREAPPGGSGPPTTPAGSGQSEQ